MKLFWYILFSIVFVGSTSAQECETVLEDSKIMVGEQIMLTYHIRLPKNGKVEFTPQQANIFAKKFVPNSVLESKATTELEIMEPFSDTVLMIRGNKEWFGTYTITAWDTGAFIIPSTTFSLNGKMYNLPAARLRVDMVSAKKGQGIYDIRESFAEIPPKPILQQIKDFHANNWWWFDPFWLIVIGIIIYFRLKKINQVPKKVKELSLKDKTIIAIDALEKSKLWTKGKLKEHYIELSFILRSYLSSRYEINLLEKTTYETKLLLTQKGLHRETVEVIGEILDQADMVKFAKSAPEEIKVLSVSVLAKQIVAETSPIEFENVQ